MISKHLMALAESGDAVAAAIAREARAMTAERFAQEGGDMSALLHNAEEYRRYERMKADARTLLDGPPRDRLYARESDAFEDAAWYPVIEPIWNELLLARRRFNALELTLAYLERPDHHWRPAQYAEVKTLAQWIEAAREAIRLGEAALRLRRPNGWRDTVGRESADREAWRSTFMQTRY